MSEDSIPNDSVNNTEKNTDRRLLNLAPAWPKGVTGNPGGRPRGNLISLSRACTNNGADIVAFMRLVMAGTMPAVLNSAGEEIIPEQAGKVILPDRLRASEWLSDHGYGKVDTASAVSTWDIVRQMVAEMLAVIDSEPVNAEVAARIKSRWREIYSRY